MNKKEYFVAAREKILSLIAEGRLVDAEQACYEALTQDTSNKAIIRLLAKVQAHLDREMRKSLALYFKTATPALKAEYAEHKKDFVRI